MKKGQIEIAGLLIIVVLVSIVLLFVLSFDVENSTNNVDEDRELADAPIITGFGPVLFETSTNCYGRNVRELLSDCAFNKQIMCPEGKDSCEFVNETIEGLLNETLTKYGFSYNLEVKSETNIITFFNDTGCNPSISNYKKKISPFVTDFGPMNMVIVQCI